jgi:hypothetical protein
MINLLTQHSTLDRAKIVLLSIGMDTPQKLKEERIWASWFKGMLGNDVYLLNVLSCNGDMHEIDYMTDEVDCRLGIDNFGHIPGVCLGLNTGLSYLKENDWVGPVVLTCPDVIADDGFKDIISVCGDYRYRYDIYVHDWGLSCYATDWIYITPSVLYEYEFPHLIMLKNADYNTPIMCDDTDKIFLAPDYSNSLEMWNYGYINNKKWKIHTTVNKDNVAWPPNVGVKMWVDGVRFNIIHNAAGTPRSSKTHLTNKYMEFDRPYGT